MNIRTAESLLRFAPISLEQLNAKAEMLDRLDNKYVIPLESLHKAMGLLAGSFDVLTIGSKRAFTYATRYYDDVNMQAYHDHHQGRRKRCKIRVRDYLDAGLSFLEIKLKGPAERTIKKRLKLDAASDGMGENGRNFVEQSYSAAYEKPFGKPLFPVISMQYERITLVARQGGERMTIDASLIFSAGGQTRQADQDMVIIETKSANGNGLADKVLRSLHLHPVKRCSKYCVGMAALGQVSRRNRFLPALNKLGLAGAAGWLETPQCATLAA